MAVTAYSQVVSLIPEYWEFALWYAAHTFSMPGNVSLFADHSGMTPRNISEYTENGIAQAVSESTDITARQLIRSLLSTLTPQEYGDRVDLYDQRVETDPESVMTDAAADLGYSLGKSMELNLLNTLTDVTGGNIGNGSAAFSLTPLFEARAYLERQGIRGPYIAAVHPYHFLDIAKDVIDLSKPADLSYRERLFSVYQMPGFADMRIFVPSLHPSAPVQTWTMGGVPTGGTFTITVQMGDVSATTAAQAFNETAANIQTDLEALSNVTAGDVTVTGSAGGPWTVTWAHYGYTPTVTFDNALLTGGTSPGVTSVEASAKAKSVLYTRDALALDMRRGLRIEAERDASERRTELVATQIYATGLWRGSRGVTMNYDATSPVS